MSALARPSRLVAVALAAGLITGACVGTPPPAPTSDPEATGVTVPDHVRVRVADRVQTLPLEAYVLGSILAEFSPVGESEGTARRILELQSILARTYAAANIGRHRAEGFDLCDSTHCQVYEPDRLERSSFAALAHEAVATTRGRVVAFANRPAQTLFHADCGGMLAAAGDVWGGTPVAYLPAGADAVPSDTHRRWHFEGDAMALAEALDADTRSAVGPPLAGLAIVRADASGRAAEIEIRGRQTIRLRGDTFRAILNATFGPTAIRSTRFEIEQVGDRFLFRGTGYGHGVGLCQVGAAARARRGESVQAILAAYYPGARLATAAP